MPGKVDIDKTKNKIKDMSGGKGGTVVTPTQERSPRRTQAEIVKGGDSFCGGPGRD